MNTEKIEKRFKHIQLNKQTNTRLLTFQCAKAHENW